MKKGGVETFFYAENLFYLFYLFILHVFVMNIHNKNEYIILKVDVVFLSFVQFLLFMIY